MSTKKSSKARPDRRTPAYPVNGAQRNRADDQSKKKWRNMAIYGAVLIIISLVALYVLERMQ